MGDLPKKQNYEKVKLKLSDRKSRQKFQVYPEKFLEPFKL